MVSKISKTRISEIIPSDNGDRWYKARVTFITIDEESGKEKRTSQQVLVYSDNVKEAYDQIIEAMQGMMADFEISGINESTILDVFPYSAAEKSDLPPHLKPVEPFVATTELQDKADFLADAEDQDLNDDLDPIEQD